MNLDTGRRPVRWAPWLLLLAAVILVCTGLVLNARSHGTDGVPAASGGTPAGTVTPSTAGATTVPTAPTASKGAPREARSRWHAGMPRRLVLDGLGVDAPVVPIGATDRTLIPPSDPQVLGWWSQGALPGAARGSALITGHTVHTGGGALDQLGTVAVGSLVVVRTPGQRLPYVVRSVRTYSKGRITQDAARLFSQDVPGRLVIVTCGDWNGSEYLSNVVVTAVVKHGPTTPHRRRH